MGIARNETALHLIRVSGPNGLVVEFDHAGWEGRPGYVPPLAVKAAYRLAYYLGEGDAGDPLGLPERVRDVLATLDACGADPLACSVEVAAAAEPGPDAPHGWRPVYAVRVAAPAAGPALAGGL